MIDDPTATAVVPGAAAPVFTMLGEADAVVCEGDSCLIPQHHEQLIVNRRLDDDAV